MVVKGELAFNMDTAAERSIWKKNCKPEEINPLEVPIGVPLKVDKVADVGKLLAKHFGEKWKDLESLKWYKSVLDYDSHLPDEQCECETQEDFGRDLILMSI